jgi:hypothetical protein
MGVIDQPIPRKSFEYISDRIAALLSDELYQQSAIQYDSDLLVRVFKDRMVPINASECPAINVTYNETDYKGETAHELHIKSACVAIPVGVDQMYTLQVVA